MTQEENRRDGNSAKSTESKDKAVAKVLQDFLLYPPVTKKNLLKTDLDKRHVGLYNTYIQIIWRCFIMRTNKQRCVCFNDETWEKAKKLAEMETRPISNWLDVMINQAWKEASKNG